MKPITKAARMYRQGFKLWRIADELQISVEAVADLLVQAGVFPVAVVELRLHHGRRPPMRPRPRSVARPSVPRNRP